MFNLMILTLQVDLSFLFHEFFSDTQARMFAGTTFLWWIYRNRNS